MKLSREKLSRIIKEELEEMMDDSEKTAPITIPRGIVQIYINNLNSSLSYLETNQLNKVSSLIQSVVRELEENLK